MAEDLKLPNVKFHRCCGGNIFLTRNDTVAIRHTGYNDGIVFKDKFLKPGEIFLVEILQNVDGWNGFLRIGVTQMHPRIFESQLSVPKYSLPDLMTLSSSWVYGVSKMRKRYNVESPWPGEMKLSNIAETKTTIQTCRGTYSKFLLRKMTADLVEGTLPNSVGSRVGVVYVPANEKLADLHLIYNGELFGPVAIDIPYKETPLFPVIDVYGKTRKVKVVDIKPVLALKELCREAICRKYSKHYVLSSSIPQALKEYVVEWFGVV